MRFPQKYENIFFGKEKNKPSNTHQKAKKKVEPHNFESQTFNV